jgi:hypothetical protein
MTKELWGVGSTAPYLHDGRATTLASAILEHGGEAQASRNAFAALSETAQANVVAFLNNLVLFKQEEGDASACDELPEWQVTTYSGGTRVQNNDKIYECKPYPFSGWCGQVGYEPGATLYWQDAWILIGPC